MQNSESFKNTLNQEYDFPCNYSFKFIVKKDLQKMVLNLLPKAENTIKNSKKGTYVSITLMAFMKNSDEIVYIYDKASKIEGIISL
jgi:uncharacterized protein|tara:strand:- start:7929 stop:8186 length:258 start_codon:yes stop_codon:yes gene_type:complete